MSYKSLLSYKSFRSIAANLLEMALWLFVVSWFSAADRTPSALREIALIVGGMATILFLVSFVIFFRSEGRE